MANANESNQPVPGSGLTAEERDLMLSGVASGKRIVFVTYSLTDNIERQLDFLIAVVLKKYARESLQATLYSCLKEIVINATKANAKRVFFDECGLRLNDPVDYEIGMKKVKALLSENWIKEYGHKARERDMHVSIAMRHSEDGLRIEVTNESDILPADEERIRQKLAEGMTYEDLVSFYMKNADNTEGEGLGLVMNLILLKGENINPALFRIGMVDGKAMARLEIPFTDNFVSVRGSNPKGFSAGKDHGEVQIDLR